MATITLHGDVFHTCGELPAIGSPAPDFLLVNSELKDVSLDSWPNKKKLLSVVPSLDTPVCASSTEEFNRRAADFQDSVFLVISADLPFAIARFCNVKAKPADNTFALSLMRSRDFAKDYGVLIEDGPLAGITARAVVVMDADNRVLYTQLVPEIGDEPDYKAALAALNDPAEADVSD